MFQNSSLYKESIINFEKNFGEKPKFISYAPGRINVIGEHTDYTEGTFNSSGDQLLGLCVF